MKFSTTTFAGLALASLPSTLGALQKICSGADDGNICVSAGIPSSKTSEKLYLRIEAPASKGWAAVGTGSRMVGSAMFILYRNGNGGLTVSPRTTEGYQQPQHDDDIEIKVLNGTGIVGNTWVANIECSNCMDEADLSVNGNTNFIFAANSQDDIESTDLNEGFSRHRVNGRYRNSISLAQATVDEADPFGTSSGGNSNNGGDSSSGDAPKGGDSTNNGGSGDNNQGTGSDNNNSGGKSVAYTLDPKKIILIHGILMVAAFLFLFPIGAFLLRLPLVPARFRVRTHYSIQLLSYACVLASLGLIVNQCAAKDNHFISTHQKLGLVPPIILLLQVFLGIGHHMLYKRNGTSKGVGTVHVYLGRATIVLGIATAATGVNWAYQLFYIESRTTYIALLAALCAVAGVWVVAFVVAVVVRAVSGSRKEGRRGKY